MLNTSTCAIEQVTVHTTAQLATRAIPSTASRSACRLSGLVASIVVASMLGGCAVVSVASAAVGVASTAVSVTAGAAGVAADAAVGTAKVAGKVAGKVVDAAVD